MTVFCEDCEFRHPDSKAREPWAARCMKVPTRPGYKFVSRAYSPDPPYERCDRINTDGDCAMFAPARKPPEEIAA